MEYYSELNNPKYEYYAKKIQNTLNTPVMKDFISKEYNNKETSDNNNDNTNKDKSNEEQPKEILNEVSDEVKEVSIQNKGEESIQRQEKSQSQGELKEKGINTLKVEMSKEMNDDIIHISDDDEEEVEDEGDDN